MMFPKVLALLNAFAGLMWIVTDRPDWAAVSFAVACFLLLLGSYEHP